MKMSMNKMSNLSPESPESLKHPVEMETSIIHEKTDIQKEGLKEFAKWIEKIPYEVHSTFKEGFDAISDEFRRLEQIAGFKLACWFPPLSLCLSPGEVKIDEHLFLLMEISHRNTPNEVNGVEIPTRPSSTCVIAEFIKNNFREELSTRVLEENGIAAYIFGWMHKMPREEVEEIERWICKYVKNAEDIMKSAKIRSEAREKYHLLNNNCELDGDRSSWTTT